MSSKQSMKNLQNVSWLLSTQRALHEKDFLAKAAAYEVNANEHYKKQ